SSHQARPKAPTTRAMPVARCRIDMTMVICQRYTWRWGDSGRLGCVIAACISRWAAQAPRWLLQAGVAGRVLRPAASEVDAAPVLFPVPVARRIRTLATTI